MVLCLYRPILHFIFLKKGLLDGQWPLCICCICRSGPVRAVLIYIMVKNSSDENWTLAINFLGDKVKSQA